MVGPVSIDKVRKAREEVKANYSDDFEEFELVGIDLYVWHPELPNAWHLAESVD